MKPSSDIEQKLIHIGAPPSTIIEKFIHGSGSGGQKINKTSSCVYLKHITTGIEVKCQLERSREMNRQIARQELLRKIQSLHDSIAAKKKEAFEKNRRSNRQRSKNAKRRILAAKKKNATKKKYRQKPSLDE